MELISKISKISKGSKMDQVYLPKNRIGLPIGSYVVINQLDSTQIKSIKPVFYNIKIIEPIKLKIINEIFQIIKQPENIIITGSFIEKGFNFNDIDILIISEKELNLQHLKKVLESRIGIKTHFILISNTELIKGLATDPLYQIMLSKCISSKRIIYNFKKKIDYKILDLHLLKSKSLMNNFDILDGNDKYYLTRNMVSILLFLTLKKITKDEVDNQIKKLFDTDINKIKANILNKKKLLKKYKQIYNKTFNLIMEGIKHGSK